MPDDGLTADATDGNAAYVAEMERRDVEGDTPPPPADELEALAEAIKQDHADALAHFSEAVHKAYSAGRKLNAAKQMVRDKYGHGAWLPWLKENVKIPQHRAQAYMRLAGYLDGMPDLHDVVAGLSFRQTMRVLGDEYEARGLDRSKSLVEIAERLPILGEEMLRLFYRARELCGSPEAWSEWLADNHYEAENVAVLFQFKFQHENHHAAEYKYLHLPKSKEWLAVLHNERVLDDPARPSGPGRPDTSGGDKKSKNTRVSHLKNGGPQT